MHWETYGGQATMKYEGLDVERVRTLNKKYFIVVHPTKHPRHGLTFLNNTFLSCYFKMKGILEILINNQIHLHYFP